MSIDDFSLSRKPQSVFPTEIDENGVSYRVNADFRVILKIMRLMNDKRLPSGYRYSHLRRLFYVDSIPNDWLACFVSFITGSMGESHAGSETGNDISEKQFDYEYDAKEIYLSFLREYGMDLYEVSFLHFYKFKAMLEGLSADSPFMRKIQLRFKDLTGYKGRELVRLTEAKEAVQLPVEYTAEELREIDEFERVWGNVGNDR